MRLNYFSNTKGSMAVYFAGVLMLIIMASGVAIDATGMQRLQTKYQNIADAAVLSAAKSRPKEQSAMHTVAERVVQKNNNTGTALSTTTVLSTDRKMLSVTLDGAYKPAIMGMFGKSSVDVSVTAETLIEVADHTDIVLVLDTTASMKYDNRLPSLKTSAKNFLDIIEDIDSDKIRISVVPYAQYVNVGMGVRNEPWIDVPADWVEYFPQQCSTHTPQTGTQPPCSMQSYPATPARPATPPTPPSTCSDDGVSYSCGGSSGSPGRPGSPGGTREVCTPVYGSPVTTCHTPPPVYHVWSGCVGSRAGGDNLVPNYTSGSSKVPGFLDTTCSVPLLPMTTNLNSARTKIDSMTAKDFTYSAAGLMWGWRMLDTNQPFANNPSIPAGARHKKVVVFMTDGLNTLSRTGQTHTGSNRADSDNTTEAACNGLKTVDDIEIYTITFKVFDNQAKNLVRDCATNPEFYYNATSASTLHVAFEQIALNLLSPRITH